MGDATNTRLALSTLACVHHASSDSQPAGCRCGEGVTRLDNHQTRHISSASVASKQLGINRCTHATQSEEAIRRQGGKGSASQVTLLTSCGEHSG